MTTSVPTVIPLDEMRWQMAKLLELCMEASSISGDVSAFTTALPVVRRLYEASFKEAANMGRMDAAYVVEVGKMLDKVEDIVNRARARIAAQTMEQQS